MSLPFILLCAYGAIGVLIFFYIVISAICWDGKHDKLIPYYFGVQLDMQGFRGLLTQALLAGLLWFVLLLWIAYTYFKMK